MPRAKAKVAEGVAPATPFGDPVSYSGTVERPVPKAGLSMEAFGKATVLGDNGVHPVERMNPEYHAKAVKDNEEKIKKAKESFGFSGLATIIGASPNSPQSTKFVFH